MVSIGDEIRKYIFKESDKNNFPKGIHYHF